MNMNFLVHPTTMAHPIIGANPGDNQPCGNLGACRLGGDRCRWSIYLYPFKVFTFEKRQ